MNRIALAAELVGLLSDLGHESALVGGLAVSVRARPRYTRDVDLAVAVPSDSESEQLVLTLQQRGLRLLAVLEQEAVGRLATARMIHRVDSGTQPTIDLLFATSGIEGEIVSTAEPLEVERGVWLPVARVPHLIATKLLSEREGREQDREDLRVLLAVATIDDIDETRRLLELIESGKYARGKDLPTLLEQYLLEE